MDDILQTTLLLYLMDIDSCFIQISQGMERNDQIDNKNTWSGNG